MVDLSSMFGSTDDQKNPFDVLLTLLDPNNIEMKSELNMTQIKTMCQAKWFSILKANPDKNGWDLLDTKLIPYLMKLMVSKGRESRKESIKGLSDMRDKLLEAKTAMEEAFS